VKLGGQTVENNVVFAVLAYAFVYVSCIIVFTLLLTLSGADVVTAFSAAVASINNTGPGLAQVGPASTYAVLNDFQTWICSFAMLRAAGAVYAARGADAGVLAEVSKTQ
jgi:trk system potassium uptake protein TrkH